VLVYFVVTCKNFWYKAYTLVRSSACTSFILALCACKSYMQGSPWTQQIYLRNVIYFRFSQHSGNYELWNDLKVLLLVK
jgi:hypothetical protein